MKIRDLVRESVQNRVRVSAAVEWEDCDRGVEEIYFETPEEFADSLSNDPHAFLVACIAPAMEYGEARVCIDAEICPELRGGIMTAMSCLHHWHYPPERAIPRIEAGIKSRGSEPPVPKRAGFFFSGGVDSYSTLRANRNEFPLTHPGSLKDGVLIFGFEISAPQAYDHVEELLAPVARLAGITFIPVYTNIYLNFREEDARNGCRLWLDKFQGAMFAAVAHAFSNRLAEMTISSSLNIADLIPYGTHPLIDPNFSSHDFRIRHWGIALSRLDKLRLIADWDVAMKNLRVFNRVHMYRSGQFNCGQCEKCVRTMLELLALDALDNTDAFPDKVLDETRVMKAGPIPNSELANYLELVAPLEEKGRHDLARAVKRKISHSRNPWKTVFKTKAKQLARRMLSR